MPNKWRRHRPLQVPEDTNEREGFLDLTKGLLLDRSPRVIPPGYSPAMEHVRFESGAIRKDFGSTAVGTAAASRVIGIGEHKYILNQEQFHRLIRLRRINEQVAVDIWNGSSWVYTDLSDEDIANVYLSLASMQNRFLLADGQYILTWYESSGQDPQQDDFPSGNSLTDEGESTSATINPAGAIGDAYDVRFSVDLTITNGSDYTVTVALKHNTTEVMSRAYELASGSDSWLDELFALIREVALNDTLVLEVKDIAAGTKPTKSVNFSSGGTYDYEATKTQDDRDQSTSKVFHISVGPMTVDTDVTFYYDSGSGWTLITTVTYDVATGTGNHDEPFGLGDIPVNGKFAFSRTAGDGNVSPQTPGVTWTALEETTDFTLDVHGYNDPTDADPYPGVTYQTPATIVSILEQLSADAPAARFIIPFGDRLIAYRDGGDPQVVSWSADGDITDWVGGDSGQVTLLDTRSDALDALQGAAVLSGSTLAVFRQRSIMRAQETGNVQLAVGHYHWIEELGTESPFSIQETPVGILFLGHDLQVYLLTVQGPQPVGQAIHEELIQRVTSNLDLVDSGYDGVFGEYYLGVPEDNASAITGVYIFELARFVARQEAKWRYRPLDVERFATVSEIE